MKGLVLGAGIDALVAAHYLRLAGHEVTVLGVECEHEAPPHTGWIPPHVIADLGLERRGFVSGWPDPWACAVLPDGGRLTLWRDIRRTAEQIGRFNAGDAEQWPRFCARMHALAGALGQLYSEPPPDPLTHEAGRFLDIARAALRFRKLGAAGMRDLLRLLPMSIADLLDAWFESDALKGVLGAQGVLHLAAGPRSGGTAFNFLHHHVGAPAGVFRQPRSNLHQVLSALPGLARLGRDVTRIEVLDGRVRAVVLDNGESLPASLVISDADPRRILLELTDPGGLDPELVRALRNIRSRGVDTEIAVTLDRDPGFTTLAIAPSLDHLERAYDDSKYGRVSRDPYLDTHHEASSDGGHRVRVHMQYTPYALREGVWNDDARGELAQLAIAGIESALPGFSSSVIARSVLTPPDLERERGCLQGQPYQAEVALDQMLWMRPVPQLARYRTPIANLYLCGASMHPGIAGATGANAAREILEDLKKKR